MHQQCNQYITQRLCQRSNKYFSLYILEKAKYLDNCLYTFQQNHINTEQIYVL